MQKINKSKRITIQIPKGTDIHDFLYITHERTPGSKWEILNQVIKQLPKSKEERVISAYDNFIKTIIELYPEKKQQLELLRPLIIKKIIGGCELDDWYYEELKKI